ncbi:hypothetical protein EK599_11030 [Vibrio sp. T187]|nr:outer membrane beta-barrel protein [Vibrio profundi]MBW3696234.1 hypothetical protein [Vibrio sp. T187]
MDSHHQFHIGFERSRVDKNGAEGQRKLEDIEEPTPIPFPTLIGYSYFPNVFWGMEAKYSLAYDHILDGNTKSKVTLNSFHLGLVVRQPWLWLLPYAKLGGTYYEGEENISTDGVFISQDKFHGVRPYAGVGASVYIPIFNSGHELELGAEYSYQQFGHGYSISSIKTYISYHFF